MHTAIAFRGAGGVRRSGALSAARGRAGEMNGGFATEMEPFYALLVFAGTRLYVRGQTNLYCIGNK